MQWSASGDARAPHCVNIQGLGAVNDIRDKMFAAIDKHPLRK
jgi:hypothetical protein